MRQGGSAAHRIPLSLLFRVEQPGFSLPASGTPPQQIDCALVKMDVRNGKEQTAGQAPLMGHRATQAERAWDILGD